MKLFARDKRPPMPLRQDQAVLLLLTVLLTLVPHAPDLPPWLAGLSALLLAWRLALLPTRRRPAPTMPPRWLVLLVGVAAVGGVGLNFGTILGKDPGLATLAVLLCLKLLEGNSARDARAAIFLGLFLQLGLFLNNQTLPVAVVAVLGTLAGLATLNALLDQPRPAHVRLRTAGVLLLQGLPIMLVFFVLFPRIPGPLWGLPADAHSGRTGLSDRMEPGSISDLSESPEIALRARFPGPRPPQAQLYWRGPVLTLFDGRSWRPLELGYTSAPSYTPSGTAYPYELTLEPHNQPWLLALDYPAAGADGLYARDLRLLARQPVRNRSRFELTAYPQAQVGLDEHPRVLRAALQLPEGGNPRARALARRLAQDATNPGEIVQRTLAYFVSADLAYTLRPPLMESDSVDTFLFDAKRGFCEHYASAFVFVMRAAGVPARVVLGYQGGEVNPVDQVVQVRQSDAHAWSEVWLSGRGWVRVDPTAASHPRRLEEAGLNGVLPATEIAGLGLINRANMEWLRNLRHRWEALNNLWNQQVLGYNRSAQRELLRHLGFADGDWRELITLLGGISVALLALLLVWAHRRRAQGDALDRGWARLCRQLARHDLARQPWEGPQAYARRVSRADPQRGQAFAPLAAEYAALRYGPPTDPARLRRFLQQARMFRP